MVCLRTLGVGLCEPGLGSEMKEAVCLEGTCVLIGPALRRVSLQQIPSRPGLLLPSDVSPHLEASLLTDSREKHKFSWHGRNACTRMRFDFLLS